MTFLFCFFAEVKASFIISSADEGAFWANADVMEMNNNAGNKKVFFIV